MKIGLVELSMQNRVGMDAKFDLGQLRLAQCSKMHSQRRTPSGADPGAFERVDEGFRDDD
jgi:hypothetical protein